MTDYLKHKTDLNDAAISSTFDELSFWASRFGSLLFKQIEIRRGLNILDVGFGNGFPLFELASVFGASCRVTGIDVWTRAIERARYKLSVYKAPNVRIIEADGARQPFMDGEFDLIVSNLGLNNWTEPERVLAECFRVAKQGAQLVLTTNFKGHYREFYEVWRELLSDSKKAEYLERLDAQEAHRGTKQSLQALLGESGWQVSRAVEDSFQMRFADGTALLNHWLTKIGFLGGWRSIFNPEDEREGFKALETKLNEIAGQAGELRMTVPMLYLEAQKPVQG